MKSSTFFSKAPDGVDVYVNEWLPDEADSIKAVIQIAHGMAEHSLRYEDFARILTQNNVAVYAHDHRGHGKTAGDLAKVGFLSKNQGWEKVIDDVKRIHLHVREKHPGKPVFMLGHSMGSFVVRTVITDPKLNIAGVVISGTADDPGLLGQAGILVASLLKLLYPANRPSPLMDQLSFGAFNKPFRPNRTKFDWLSRDEAQVDLYVADPWCGAVFSSGFFKDMLRGLMHISRQSSINKTPVSLPMLFFSGDQDPVGNQGRGVQNVVKRYHKAGIKDMQLKLFAGGRHEMLNEINREEVWELILTWMNEKLDH